MFQESAKEEDNMEAKKPEEKVVWMGSVEDVLELITNGMAKEALYTGMSTIFYGRDREGNLVTYMDPDSEAWFPKVTEEILPSLFANPAETFKETGAAKKRIAVLEEQGTIWRIRTPDGQHLIIAKREDEFFGIMVPKEAFFKKD